MSIFFKTKLMLPLVNPLLNSFKSAIIQEKEMFQTAYCRLLKIKLQGAHWETFFFFFYEIHLGGNRCIFLWTL